MGDDFDASAVELVEMQGAALAEIAKTTVQSAERIEELRAESQARVDDIGKQVALAEIEARQQTDRAFELAQVAAEAAKKATVAAVARASARADRQFAATEGELEAGKKAVEQEATYLTAKKNQILVYRGEEHIAAGKTRDSLLATAEPTFAGLFFDQMKEYSLDWVQDKLRGVATVAAFIPGVGWLISGMAGVADGAISYYRGDRVGGLIEIGLSAIPLVGRFGKIGRTVLGYNGRLGGTLVAGEGIVLRQSYNMGLRVARQDILMANRNLYNRFIASGGKLVLRRDILNIKKGELIRGTFNPLTKEITLFHGSDMSTLSHELIHFSQFERYGTAWKGLTARKYNVLKDLFEQQVDIVLKEWGYVPL